MTKFLLMLGKAYLGLAVVQFIIGVCFGLWMVYNGQQPLDWLTG